MTYFVNVDDGPEVTPLGVMEPTAGASFKASVQSTFAENPATMLYEFDKLYGSRWNGANVGKKVDPTSAAQQVKEAGVKLSIPEEGYTQQALDILIQRRRDEIARQTINDRTPWSWLGSPVRGAGMLMAGAVDPLNVASAFIPVVGEARVAGMLARAGEGVMARAGVRAGVGAIEGLAGAVALEPLVYGLHSQMQDDYDMSDSLINLAFGTVLGGGLHVAGGALADSFRPPRRLPTVVADAVESLGRTERAQLAALQAMTPETARAQAVAEIRAELEGPAGGMVRLYHGGLAMDGASGRFVQGSLSYAEQYAQKAAGGDGRVFYIDVPETDPRLIKAFDDTGTSSKAPYVPFELRDGEAAGMRELGLEADQLDAGTVPERFAARVDERAKTLLEASKAARGPLPAEGVVQAATPEIREAALRAAVADMAQGRNPDVAPIFDGGAPGDIQARNARQQAPDSLAVGNPAAADAATQRLAEAPKDALLESAEAEATEASQRVTALLQNLQASGFDPERIAKMADALKPFDEGIADAANIGKAIEAVTLCQVRQ